MSSVAMRNGEVQYYASPILVKNQEYYATLTNERLIIEGSASPREFRVSSIIAASPARLSDNEPGLNLIFSTPSGQREMVWTFPLEPVFKAGEQEAWLSNIAKVVGDKPFAVAPDQPITAAPAPRYTPAEEPVVVSTEIVSLADVPEQEAAPERAGGPELIHGESVIIDTAGVRIKRSFFTLYLTNLRLILQNKAGKTGREFAIAELIDAAALETDAGEPAIALSVGSQSGLKQMLLTYPTVSSRDGWMIELENKIPRRSPAVQAGSAVSADRVGTFVPATNERVLVTTPNVRIKQSVVVIHLTNTRFVIDGKSGIMGEFALNSLLRAVRMASEIGEPGISLKIGSPKGERNMHLVFGSMNDREAWMEALHEVIPDEGAVASVPPVKEYTVTTVKPPAAENTQTVCCPSCGTKNHTDDDYCALCGTFLHAQSAVKPGESARMRADEDEPEEKVLRRERRSRPEREPKERVPYNGSGIGFITRPSDAFAYYSHEHPKSAAGMFLAAGAVWAFVTVLLIAYIVPAVLKIDVSAFPIFSALQTNILLLAAFAVLLYVIWLAALLVHAFVTAAVSHVFDPNARFGEVAAIVMRSSLTFAVVGWIPIFGMFAASVWSVVVTWKGLIAGQEMRGVSAMISAVLGAVIVYIALFALGMM
ncbi:MAG: hypothetical protein Q4Q04_00630 [Methanocorpusculum sp.]|nr:hypothetical protein [Methanocorpusculum sp.]